MLVSSGARCHPGDPEGEQVTPVVWFERVFNTHHGAQGFLNLIKRKHIAVIEIHGATQWRVAYLAEGEGMPLTSAR